MRYFSAGLLIVVVSFLAPANSFAKTKSDKQKALDKCTHTYNVDVVNCDKNSKTNNQLDACITNAKTNYRSCTASAARYGSGGNNITLQPDTSQQQQ